MTSQHEALAAALARRVLQEMDNGQVLNFARLVLAERFTQMDKDELLDEVRSFAPDLLENNHVSRTTI